MNIRTKISLITIILISKVLGKPPNCNSKRCDDETSAFKSQLNSGQSSDSASALSALQDTLLTMSAVMTSTLPDDCSAAMRKGSNSIFQLIAPTGMCPRMVRCDMTTDGGGWTVALWRSPFRAPHRIPDHNAEPLARFCKIMTSKMGNAASSEIGSSLDKTGNRPRDNELLPGWIAGQSLPGRKRGRDKESRKNPLGRENFNRTWNEYKTGFGDYRGEYWIGNDMLHALTTSTDDPWEALVLLRDFSGDTANAVYKQFRVSDEGNHYELHARGFQNTPHSAGDGLDFHHGRFFSTFDRDNDRFDASHCGQEYGAGWWFHQCHMSLLTGVAGNLPQRGHHTLHWSKWRRDETLQFAALLIRPKASS